MKALHLTAKFDKDTTHYVNVHIYSTKAKMFRALGYKMSAGCLAAFREEVFPGRTGCVGGLFFYWDEFNLNSLVHECSHASAARSRLLGFVKSGECEEVIAESTGNLVDRLIGYLGVRDIAIPVEAQSNGKKVKLLVAELGI